ncbi:MAG: CHAT domain-containing protein, partial [Saprospiraceae bacterium]|nr:CHAT domain-containing protein [Saprospiraceae bacterium]
DSLLKAAINANIQFDEQKAMEFNRLAEKLALDHFGRVSPIYARVRLNYGQIQYNLEDWFESENGYKDALDIQMIAHGRLSKEYSETLLNLGILNLTRCDYLKAEINFLEAKDIIGKLFGKTSKEYTNPLIDLGILYSDRGDYRKSEIQYQEAAAILSANPGSNSYARCLVNQSWMYFLKGDYDKAEPLALKSSEILKKNMGQDNFYYGMTLYNLGCLYLRKHDYARSESFFEGGRLIFEKTVGKDNPNYTDCISDMADLFALQGRFSAAEGYFLEARDNREKMLGKLHPSYTSSLYSLAKFYQRSGRIPESTIHFLELNRLVRQHIEKSAEYSSETEMIAFLQTFNEKLDGFQSFAHDHSSPEFCRESYNNALFFNGLVLENNRILARAIADADSLTREVYKKWQGCHRRLAKRYARPIGDRKKIAEVELEAEEYEKQLLRNLPGFNKTHESPRWQDVRNQLKPDELAIEFIHYDYFRPDATDSVLYAALLLRSGWDAPRLFPLFEEKELTALLKSHGAQKSENMARLYALSERGIIATEQTNSLYKLIWEPLEKEIRMELSGGAKNISSIYFAPSGLLHQINLAAIPCSEDSILGDRYHLIEMGSTRQLAAQAEKIDVYRNDAILFGGIQYDMDSLAIFEANASLNQADLASRSAANDSYETGNFRGETWNYLKWTDKEVNTIQSVLSSDGYNTEIKKGFIATEEAFKSIGTNGYSPRILHLATHGFFFPDPQKQGKTLEDLDSEVGFKASNNPLIRSGLLLAGANHAWKHGKPLKKGMENGILTAYEISHLNLSHTELVVLSACETGLGDIRGNEGVFGLQRAFKIAGARYLIMSLWQVPDRETAEFMTTFYKKWLTEKMSIPEAFRTTQNEMRERFINPYSWAGFVLVE